MARRIVHELIDDLDGTVIEPGEGETVRFSLGGTAYEIDLTNANAAALRAALEPYIAAGRRASAAVSTAAPRKRASGSGDAAKIREWAAANGFKVSERGRVPASVVEAYRAAN